SVGVPAGALAEVGACAAGSPAPASRKTPRTASRIFRIGHRLHRPSERSRLPMWTRRRFLETASGLPLLGGLVAAAEPAAPAAARPVRDYFRDLGVRPFINAAGTYTAMTASLMAPEVMDAINYASGHFVMLDELHDKVGERIATRLRCEAAMATSGAASALTPGPAAVLTGTD